MSRTGAPEDAAEAIATARGLVDEVLHFAAGEITDFSERRNRMLTDAAGAGFDWAIMLDTDERIVVDGQVVGIGDVGTGHGLALDRDLLQVWLAETTADVLMVRHVGGTYEKERIFRLPVRGHYHGRTHEAFIMDAGSIRSTTRGLHFDEVPKTPDAYHLKVERDLPLLQEQIRETPDDPRWWYYLGDTESGMGHPREASAAFQRCWELDGWDEESAWAAYRVAEILSGEGKFNEAILWCTKGMQRHPGVSELPWLAGWCAYQMGQHQKAVWWSEMAFALNKVGAHEGRIGFRFPVALYEGPHDVMRHSFRALGDRDGEIVAEERFQRNLDLRQRREKIAAP